MIDVALGAAGADPDGAGRWIHPHALHRREVDDEPVLDAGEAGAVMAATEDRDGEPLVTAEPDRGEDVRYVCSAGDLAGL
jgi:hypothetical protein